tara:strand:- start:1611 stop:1940 length:330 start_codon:yes stop_codon:yes gene_type:complete
MLVEKQIPNNRFDKIYKYSKLDFTGMSFLLHPDVLLYNAYKYSNKDICIYVSIASLRSYAEYLANRTIHLNIMHLPLDPYMYLDNNSLLLIAGENMHFLYEEANLQEHH